MNNELRYFDTNCLIYMVEKESVYHLSVIKIYEESVNQNLFALNDIVLIEFFQIITNPAKAQQYWSSQYAVEYIRNLINTSTEIHYQNKEIFESMLTGLVEYKISKYDIYDHIIYQLMKQNSVKELVTVNENDFKKYKDIHLIIPKETD